jgi:hypothetical protein
MLRQVLLHLLPFLLPFAAYVAYVIAMKKMEEKGGMWADAPWFWLCASGLSLVIVSLVATALLGGEPREADYEPARIENGRIVPARPQ